MPRAKSEANKVTLLICERDEGATGLDVPIDHYGKPRSGNRQTLYSRPSWPAELPSPEFYGIAENRSGNWFLDLIDRKATILSRSNGGLCGSSVCGPKIGSLRGFHSNKSGV
ncbi:hypothetical protein BHYA_0038g00140 [Botrytis hyacinthi]|uniref:Uncharacterized protein n=1 Tax=Botrytis hyacinthi TaxID=278943 RepID=A0A4Z1GZ47_9HELO|nr:hypothetical protein BHYA_0038g00140 [Botrytis hyacinthi]